MFILQIWSWSLLSFSMEEFSVDERNWGCGASRKWSVEFGWEDLEFEQCDRSPETELLETCYKKIELLPTLGVCSSDVSGDDYLSFRGFQLSNIYEIYELCVNKSPNQWRFCRTCHLFYWRWWDSTILTPGNSANCDLFGMVSSPVGDLQFGGR